MIGVALLVSGVLLWRALPHQGWVIRDTQGEWQVVAQGWALLWRCWPLVLVGAVLGDVGGVSSGFAVHAGVGFAS